MLRVKVEGLEQLGRVLDPDYLVKPELQRGVRAFEQKVLDQGTGLGAQRNTLALQKTALATNVTSTLNWPRTTGKSWQIHQEKMFEAQADKVLSVVGDRIQDRWDA